jgi:hypothetical protein
MTVCKDDATGKCILGRWSGHALGTPTKGANDDNVSDRQHRDQFSVDILPVDNAAAFRRTSSCWRNWKSGITEFALEAR